MLASALPVVVSIVACVAVSPDASADPMGLSLGSNVGFGAPAGLVSLMARVEVGRLYVEADAGWGIAGREMGGGFGVMLMTERGPTAKLGMATARLTTSVLVTRSRTDEREAGIMGGPLPELVQGGGTYTWGYLMTGVDLELDSGFYVLGEIGMVARLARRADYPMDPTPDSLIAPTIRAGAGVHF